MKRKKTDKETPAERVVRALVDRLIDNEKRLDAMAKTLDEHFEMIAEIQPQLTADGQVSMLAMRATEEDAEEFEVCLQPVTISKKGTTK